MNSHTIRTEKMMKTIMPISEHYNEGDMNSHINRTENSSWHRASTVSFYYYSRFRSVNMTSSVRAFLISQH